jgi:hypothetical protein
MLNTLTAFHILPAMKRVVLAVAVLAVVSVAPLPLSAQTAPLAGQTSQFGILFGGVKRLNDLPLSQGQKTVNDFSFSNSVKEVFFGTRLEPDTMFKIKAGEITVPVVYDTGTTDATGNKVFAQAKGKVDHVDAIVDYRFSEAFGSTGIFGGVGMYRTSAPGVADDTNAGLTAGVNADFPLSRRDGLMFEGSYHWLHTTVHQRFITLTGGLRISF